MRAQTVAARSTEPRRAPAQLNARITCVSGLLLQFAIPVTYLCRSLSFEEQARPILGRLHGYLQEQQATALPKSPLGAAIGYALRNWAALTRYAEDGRLKVDNNGAEQALRPIVLGRKNYCFAGSEAAAHRTAILCSLVQTCKHLQINPFVYRRDVIERVLTHPARLVIELTPREWKRRRQDSGAQVAA